MEIDPRGPRTAAPITTAVLAAVLITGTGWLLAVRLAPANARTTRRSLTGESAPAGIPCGC